jgi:acetyl-CoA C-acetyltransferase
MCEAYIIGAVRTATGKNQGRLSKWHAVDLGAAVVDELLVRTGMPGTQVDDLIMGCVSS